MFAKIRLQSPCRWKMFEFLCVSFHVPFLYESSSCDTCCLFKDKNTPAVFYLKRSLAGALYFVVVFSLCLGLERKAGK